MPQLVSKTTLNTSFNVTKRHFFLHFLLLIIFSYMALQSNADLRFHNGLLLISSVFLPLLPVLITHLLISVCSRFQWSRDLRCKSAAVRLLRMCVRIPPGASMSVCCECCVLSGRSLCDELIIRPEDS